MTAGKAGAGKLEMREKEKTERGLRAAKKEKIQRLE